MNVVSIFVTFFVIALLPLSSGANPPRWKELADSFTRTGDLKLLDVAFRDVMLIPEYTDRSSWVGGGRENKLVALLSLFRYVANEIDLDFDSSIGAPTTKVIPPENSGIPLGASPSDVKDPELRKKYESMIKENQKKKLKWRHELHCRNVIDEVISYTNSFIKRNYSKDDVRVLNGAFRDVLGVDYEGFNVDKYLLDLSGKVQEAR